MLSSRKALEGRRRDLTGCFVSQGLWMYLCNTHSFNGVPIPQLLATKRLVEDDLVAAAINLISDWATTGSLITMVEMMVWMLFSSRILVRLSMLS
jgi:hypothetical protein